MAARNRNRPGLVKEDADEERSLWNQIRSESKRIDALVVRRAENPFSVSRNKSKGEWHGDYLPRSWQLNITLKFLY
jgi:hypothetical protein